METTMTFQHSHCTASRIKIETSSTKGLQTVLVIDTNLELDGTGRQYDREAVDALVAAAEKYMKEHHGIDRVDFEGNRKM
jgi:hypothetical protein